MTLALESRTTIGIGALSSGRTGAAADPYGITWMLMDGALERIEAARDRHPQDRAGGASAGCLLRSAAMLIGELQAGLDLQRGGAFAANLDDLYDYMCRRLHAVAPGKANSEAAGAALDEVRHLLAALRSAWTFMPAEVRTASGN